jgi:hypothetical protein
MIKKLQIDHPANQDHHQQADNPACYKQASVENLDFMLMCI